MDDLYNIIGKLYTDIVQAQKYISLLQNDVKDKEKIIADLRIEIKSLNEQ
jgi:hypothetical protein